MPRARVYSSEPCGFPLYAHYLAPLTCLQRLFMIPVGSCRRLKTAMTTVRSTRHLSAYLKHAKGRTRTAIRSGQVWEESLKKLTQFPTNVTGKENSPDL